MVIAYFTNKVVIIESTMTWLKNESMEVDITSMLVYDCFYGKCVIIVRF